MCHQRHKLQRSKLPPTCNQYHHKDNTSHQQGLGLMINGNLKQASAGGVHIPKWCPGKQCSPS
jgi:hypothetical protein